MSFKFFQNTDCEFFPCHKLNGMNCLFCFCPLYLMDCGGNFTVTNDGKKDCSDCILPHDLDGYDFVLKKIAEYTDRRPSR
jgi:Uncharacterized protein containing a Zn-finger-like domain